MKICKRIIAGISAFVMFMSVPLNSGMIAIAEESVPAVIETQTDVDNQEIDEPIESTTTTTTSAITTTTTTGVETTTIETTTTTKNTSPPDLVVNGIDEYNWLSADTIQNWQVSAEGATVYYKTYEMISETESFEPSDDYKSEGATEWHGVDKLLEGSHYIVFWAAYPDEECEIAGPEVYQYHLDKSNPEPFELTTDTEKDGSGNYLVISDKNGISDSISGIKKVSYQINNWGVTDFDDNMIDHDTSGNIVGFSLKIDSLVENATITVYVEDMAGNVSEQEIENITHDSSIPQITEIAIADNAQQGATILECLTFGHESLNNFISHIFANDKYYLAVTVIDNNLSEILVTVNEASTPISITSGQWSCNNDSNSDKKTYYIKLSLLDDKLVENQPNTIKVVAFDGQNYSEEVESSLKELEYTVLYDKNNDNDCTVTFEPTIEPTEGNYFFEFSDDDVLNIIMKDDVGIAGYEISVNGTTITSVECKETVTETITTTVVDNDSADTMKTVTTIIEYDVKVTSTEYSLPLSDYIENKNYSVEVNLVDLAGNSNEKNYDFIVDSTPPVIEDLTYSVNPSILNFFTFGIFGNETISIDIDVQDNEYGIGVDPDKVFLYWAPTADDELHKYNATPIDEDNGLYRFENLPVDNEAVPYIVVFDKLENSNTYYFASKDTVESSDIGELMLKGDTENGVTLVLEDDKPTVSITVHSAYAKYTVAGETWYGDKIEYVVSAKDINSGLNYIDVQENNRSSKKETDFEGVNFKANRFQDEATYTYELVDANNYTIKAIAHDNAGNSSTSDELKVHIDKENPVISKFIFGNQEDLGSEIAKTTYGYYFKKETDVKIYVNDPGVTSGINKVTLYLSNVDGTTSVQTIYSTDVENYITDETGSYAIFTIPMGFKGTVYAEVVDNVEHKSGFVNADGSIIEDDNIHRSTSSIDITEDIATNKTDSANVPLYNRNIPLTITVKDTFSGISAIEWSISNDDESGIITVANDGTCNSNSSAATIGEVKTESNLVTSMQFTLSVDDNSNGNIVLIKLTDRSGNTSVVSKTYSIDTTVPVISASLSNQTPHNTIYYNTDQTVTISITERNFNASDVHFILNGSEQIIGEWSTSGSGDSAVHTGRFTINTDGDYSYSISYSDMAGNMAEVFTQSMFVIDKTTPVVKTNFDEFRTEQEKHYFGLDSINKTAKITITEHNFSAKDANVEIFRLEPGSKHNISGVESTTVSGWSDNGDEHTLEIPFEEGDDGVYLIRVNPVDLASNSGLAQETVIFEIDFTTPIISERNNIYVKNEEESYEHLEVYNEKTGVEEGFIPSVSFSDTNFDHIEYVLTIYTPEYKNGKEIGDIIPDSDIGSITETIYSLPEFKKDGVYSVDLVAVDKAGNRSILCRNTSVLMMESDVLAYISNSNKAEEKGWYSLQKDENTPISKRPDSFSDLHITVFAQESSNTAIILRNVNGESQDTGITAENSEDIYAVGVYNYVLPKEYFADNYPEGTNEDLYLWAENSLDGETSHISLGWIRLDALAPSCNLPDDLKDWKSYVSTTKKITLTNISESLDVSKCVVYDNGKEILADSFDYSDENDTLSYTLEEGWHDLSFVLVDEAGNINIIQEISSIQVGLLYCLWFRILCGISITGIIAGIIVIIVKKKKSVNK